MIISRLQGLGCTCKHFLIRFLVSTYLLSFQTVFFLSRFCNRRENEANDKSRAGKGRSENWRPFFARDFHTSRKTINLIFCPMLPSGHLLPVHEQRSEHFGVLTLQIFQIIILNAILFRLCFDRSRLSSRLMDFRWLPSLY